MPVKLRLEIQPPHCAPGHIQQNKIISKLPKIDYQIHPMLNPLNICSPVNVVIRLFRPRDDMGHVRRDTDDMAFSP